MASNAGFTAFSEKLNALAAKFQKNLALHNSDAYDEMALRNDFLNPFWSALGWDLENTAQKSQLLRDVQLETRVEIGGRKKKADYVFRTDGLDKFVCEAKRPKDGLSPTSCYQAQRYAFNLGLYVAILSDFQDLKLFVVGGKPDARLPFEPVLSLHFTEYVENAKKIWELFARDNVSQNS